MLGIIAPAFIGGLAVLRSIYRSPCIDQWATQLPAVGFVVAISL